VDEIERARKMKDQEFEDFLNEIKSFIGKTSILSRKQVCVLLGPEGEISNPYHLEEDEDEEMSYYEAKSQLEHTNTEPSVQKRRVPRKIIDTNIFNKDKEESTIIARPPKRDWKWKQKENKHNLGELHTFIDTSRDLIPSKIHDDGKHFLTDVVDYINAPDVYEHEAPLKDTIKDFLDLIDDNDGRGNDVLAVGNERVAAIRRSLFLDSQNEGNQQRSVGKLDPNLLAAMNTKEINQSKSFPEAIVGSGRLVEMRKKLEKRNDQDLRLLPAPKTKLVAPPRAEIPQKRASPSQWSYKQRKLSQPEPKKDEEEEDQSSFATLKSIMNLMRGAGSAFGSSLSLFTGGWNEEKSDGLAKDEDSLALEGMQGRCKAIKEMLEKNDEPEMAMPVLRSKSCSAMKDIFEKNDADDGEKRTMAPVRTGYVANRSRFAANEADVCSGFFIDLWLVRPWKTPCPRPGEEPPAAVNASIEGKWSMKGAKFSLR